VNIRVTALINQMSTVSAANAKTTTMKPIQLQRVIMQLEVAIYLLFDSDEIIFSLLLILSSS
jgi:hypothetical protein